MKRVYTIRNIEHKPGTNVFVLKDEDGNLKYYKRQNFFLKNYELKTGHSLKANAYNEWCTKHEYLDIYLSLALILTK